MAINLKSFESGSYLIGCHDYTNELTMDHPVGATSSVLSIFDDDDDVIETSIEIGVPLKAKKAPFQAEMWSNYLIFPFDGIEFASKPAEKVVLELFGSWSNISFLLASSENVCGLCMHADIHVWPVKCIQSEAEKGLFQASLRFANWHFYFKTWRSCECEKTQHLATLTPFFLSTKDQNLLFCYIFKSKQYVKYVASFCTAKIRTNLRFPKLGPLRQLWPSLTGRMKGDAFCGHPYL